MRVVALTNHLTDEILKVTVEAETEQGSRGAEVQGSENPSVSLDIDAETSKNGNEAQLNSGADDEQRPTFQPSTSLPTTRFTSRAKAGLGREPFDKLRTSLAVGDRLCRADGGWAKVLAVERVKLADSEPVYNFTIKGPRPYFVLEVGVLVHNTSCGLGPDT